MHSLFTFTRNSYNGSIRNVSNNTRLGIIDILGVLFYSNIFNSASIMTSRRQPRDGA